MNRQIASILAGLLVLSLFSCSQLLEPGNNTDKQPGALADDLVAMEVQIITNKNSVDANRRNRAVYEEYLLEALRVVDEAYGGRDADNTEQCQSIGFGSKPCGGHWSYLVYSILATNSAALSAAVYSYNTLEDMINKKFGTSSDCGFVTVPTLQLINDLCTSKSMNAMLR